MTLYDADLINVVAREDQVVIGTRRSDPAGGPSDYTEIACINPEKAFLLVEMLNDAIGKARAVADRKKEERLAALIKDRDALTSQIERLNREINGVRESKA